VRIFWLFELPHPQQPGITLAAGTRSREPASSPICENRRVEKDSADRLPDGGPGAVSLASPLTEVLRRTFRFDSSARR